MIRNALRRFMYGRYGMDALGKFLMGVALGLCVLNLFLHTLILSVLMWALLFYSYYRMFSKDIQMAPNTKRC